MHIPDGYLSPSTCVVMTVSAAPFWIVAIRKLRNALNARMVPLISLVSAFCFVVMMFNLPLPGGTTGHAVGMGIAAIMLGPWVAIIAISIALLLQALLFGDGGITAYGANCFNMAIVGSLAAYAIYRLISGKEPLESPRRIIAAALAGYGAINLSALCAAVELGLQPALFHDGSGSPLYAPYPLSVSVPAMLAGHLSFAGVAELVISGGLVAYFQRSDISLLRVSAPGARDASLPAPARALRPLWIGLAVLMLITPLGLLAAGEAWGEWDAQEFSNPEARQAIATASGHVQPPTHAPEGLEKLSSIWTAPFPDYAPTFLKSKNLGYILSAMFGGGILIALGLIISRLMNLTAGSLVATSRDHS